MRKCLWRCGMSETVLEMFRLRRRGMWNKMAGQIQTGCPLFYRYWSLEIPRSFSALPFLRPHF